MHSSAARKKYRSSMTTLALLSLILAAGTVFVMRLRAQTSSSGSITTQSTPPAPTVADAAPNVTLSVIATNTQVGHRPGARSYYSTTVSDDKLLKSVVVTTSPTTNSSSPNTLYQCADKTSCEEKVYIIIPSNSGENFVTVTATDSIGQVTTKTVTFQAVACATDVECGGGSVQWAGASYCSSDSPNIMQYGVAATCSAGVCDTGSKPLMKQQCGAGQVCTYGQGGFNICIAQPSACTPGTQITSICSCGTNTAYYYPVDWRVASPTFCCSNSDGSLYTTSPGPCLSAQPTSPPPASQSSASFTSSTAAASTQQPPTSNPAPLTPTPSSALPSIPAGPASVVIPLPLTSPVSLPVQYPAQPTEKVEVQSPPPFQFPPSGHQEMVSTGKKLKPRQIISLVSQKKKLIREVQSLTKMLRKEKRYDDIDTADAVLDELKKFRPRYAMDIETFEELRAVVKDLRG